MSALEGYQLWNNLFKPQKSEGLIFLVGSFLPNTSSENTMDCWLSKNPHVLVIAHPKQSVQYLQNAQSDEVNCHHPLW